MALDVSGRAARPRLGSVAPSPSKLGSRGATALELWAFPATVATACFALLALVRLRTLTSDSFMALVGGRWIAHRGLPTLDALTVSGAGRKWIDEQWLSQWILYELTRAGGFALLAVVSGILIASAFGVLALIMLERGAHPRRAIKWTTLALAVSLPDIAIRAQAFAYVLFALVLWLVLRDRERPPSLARATTLISLLVVWANVHGTVVLGSALVCAHFARQAILSRRERKRSLVIAAGALGAAATPLATPYGLDIAHYYVSVLGNSSLSQFASEWQPATANPLAATGFLALVLALGYALISGLRRGVRPPLSMLTVVGALVVAGFLELRWETWAAFVAIVLATDILNAIQPAEPPAFTLRRWGRVHAAATLFAIAGVGLLATETPRQFQRLAPLATMSAVTRYAAAHPGSRILADDKTSDGLLWTAPSLAGRIGFDDRLEIYSQPALDRWAGFIRDRQGAVIRAAAPYDVLVASAANERLAKKLRSLPGWRLLHSGADGVAVVRR